MNYTNLSALAAAVAASANTNASAGIGVLNLFTHINSSSNNNKSTDSHLSTTSSVSIDSNLNEFNKRIICINKNSEITLHQIGTNLVDLTVCWHKMNDNCNKCNAVIYKANQFFCDKCGDEFKLNSSSTYSGALETPRKHEPLNDLTISSTLLTDLDTNSLIRHDLFESAELTRKSFEEEFSTLIVNSTKGNKSLEAAFTNLLAKPKDLITEDTISKFTFK